ncbi:hypothetical protein B0H14DRAFT_2865950 [Mycena olivaceomarginata]|nr:hypothetical protein B0H14DRAFT_2865950 [Mycena olivaceomarginata]
MAMAQRPVDSVRMHSARTPPVRRTRRTEPGQARRGEEGVADGWEWGLRSTAECEQLGAMRVRNWIRRWGEVCVICRCVGTTIARRRYGWNGCGCDASVHGPGAYGSRGESECSSWFVQSTHSRHRHTWMGDAVAGEVTRCWVDGCAIEAGAQFRLAPRPEVACLGMGAAFALPAFGSRFVRGVRYILRLRHARKKYVLCNVLIFQSC